MFVSEEEILLSSDFIKNGFVKKKAEDIKSLDFIKSQLENIVLSYEGFKNTKNIDLENIHDHISPENLNDFRLYCINQISRNNNLRFSYYKVFKKFTDLLIGNELAMQKKLNLSIQLPNDNSSLLTIHADTWSGDSPFETVCWLPMVDCRKSMCMFILPAYNYKFFEERYSELKNKNSNDILESLKDKLIWIEINYGEVMVFNQNLPHGNIVNSEENTRWSFNCRFKSIFTPYKDKKLGEFFEPITLKATSKVGLNYKFPS